MAIVQVHILFRVECRSPIQISCVWGAIFKLGQFPDAYTISVSGFDRKATNAFQPESLDSQPWISSSRLYRAGLGCLGEARSAAALAARRMPGLQIEILPSRANDWLRDPCLNLVLWA